MGIVFLDIEVSADNKISDLGAVDSNNNGIHTPSQGEFANFIKGAEYIGGHNILKHDLQYLKHLDLGKKKIIDTLYLSPLMFPRKPYHKLLKDEKILSDSLNNPLLDAQKSKVLFFDEINAFHSLDDDLKAIYYHLLKSTEEFRDFFEFIDYKLPSKSFFGLMQKLIQARFSLFVCEHAPIEDFISHHPIELAYALAIINV
ncbi:MAG: RecQ family ATP-dependent DNA helicase, partial [Fibrobacter sp.]|nr:RecQ family ATP-dependent DNA helicase [Fibrobacter sp.]